MSNFNYITNLCHDIQAQGKTPSVALVRNMSNRPLSIPEVIKTLQSWKANPTQARKENEPLQSSKPTSLEARVELLEKQLAKVTLQLAQLTKSS